jgi:hypothetical protein
MPNTMWGPALLIFHVAAPSPDLGFPFHAVALWDAPTFNPWDVVLWTTGGLDWGGWDGYPDPLPQQLELAKVLIATPDYISDLCPVCNLTYDRPRAIRYNLIRGGLHNYHTPACPWDGDFPPRHWTPAYWPPAPAY